MLFKTHDSLSLLQGKLTILHGRPVMMGLDGACYGPDELAFAIPDDEPQAEAIRAAGFRTHTPLSMHLGDGSTGR